LKICKKDFYSSTTDGSSSMHKKQSLTISTTSNVSELATNVALYAPRQSAPKGGEDSVNRLLKCLDTAKKNLLMALEENDIPLAVHMDSKRIMGAIQAVLFNYAQEVLDFDNHSKKENQKIIDEDVDLDRYDLSSNIRSRLRGNSNLIGKVPANTLSTPFTPVSEATKTPIDFDETDDEFMWEKMLELHEELRHSTNKTTYYQEKVKEFAERLRKTNLQMDFLRGQLLRRDEELKNQRETFYREILLLREQIYTIREGRTEAFTTMSWNKSGALIQNDDELSVTKMRDRYEKHLNQVQQTHSKQVLEKELDFKSEFASLKNKYDSLVSSTEAIKNENAEKSLQVDDLRKAVENCQATIKGLEHDCDLYLKKLSDYETMATRLQIDIQDKQDAEKNLMERLKKISQENIQEVPFKGEFLSMDDVMERLEDLHEIRTSGGTDPRQNVELVRVTMLAEDLMTRLLQMEERMKEGRQARWEQQAQMDKLSAELNERTLRVQYLETVATETGKDQNIVKQLRAQNKRLQEEIDELKKKKGVKKEKEIPVSPPAPIIQIDDTATKELERKLAIKSEECDVHMVTVELLKKQIIELEEDKERMEQEYRDRKMVTVPKKKKEKKKVPKFEPMQKPHPHVRDDGLDAMSKNAYENLLAQKSRAEAKRQSIREMAAAQAEKSIVTTASRIILDPNNVGSYSPTRTFLEEGNYVHNTEVSTTPDQSALFEQLHSSLAKEYSTRSAQSEVFKQTLQSMNFKVKGQDTVISPTINKPILLSFDGEGTNVPKLRIPNRPTTASAVRPNSARKSTASTPRGEENIIYTPSDGTPNTPNTPRSKSSMATRRSYKVNIRTPTTPTEPSYSSGSVTHRTQLRSDAAYILTTTNMPLSARGSRK
jgi:hypothetical protein